MVSLTFASVILCPVKAAVSIVNDLITEATAPPVFFVPEYASATVLESTLTKSLPAAETVSCCNVVPADTAPVELIVTVVIDPPAALV